VNVSSVFRDKALGKRVVEHIQALMPEEGARIAHFCGTHEQVITKHGLRALLPDRLELLSGPGCPVCVTPIRDIDEAIYLAQHCATVITYGDMLRVPGSTMSLAEARAKGARVRVAYSVSDAVKMARDTREDVVFFGIGFETTAPSTAAVLLDDPPENFSILTSHRLIPPAMEALIGDGDVRIDAIIAPGHVSTIIGTTPYERFARMGIPIVVGGFEPIDVLLSVMMALRQIKEKRTEVENEYTRCVRREGNTRAQQLMKDAFTTVDAHWRGIGRIPSSGLDIKPALDEHDARRRYEIEVEDTQSIYPGCLCGLVLTAKAIPTQCELFGKVCTPQHPCGPCMVSMEGMCYNWWRYGQRE